MRIVGRSRFSTGMSADSVVNPDGVDALVDHSHQLITRPENLTLLNGWTTKSGYNPLRIAALADLIVVEGVLENAVFNATVANIPAEYRSSYLPEGSVFYQDVRASNLGLNLPFVIDTSWNIVLDTPTGVTNPVVTLTFDGFVYVKL